MTIAKGTASKNSRDLVLKAALDLFTNRGYDGTSIDDIRAAAGFKSKASLYTYFKSKEEVASALLTQLLKHEENLLIGTYEATRGDGLQKLVAMLRAFIEWGLTSPDEYTFCFIQTQQEKILQTVYGDMSQERSVSSNQLILDLVEQLRADYPVRQAPTLALLSMGTGLISRAVLDRANFGQVGLATKVEQILQATLSVLFTEPVA